jgi:hypothetical protein
MSALCLDLAHETTESTATGGTLAERVFAGLYADWQLTTFGCLHVVAPKGSPVFAGSLSEVVGQISGAAVRDRCPNGTGWPLRASA